MSLRLALAATALLSASAWAEGAPSLASVPMLLPPPELSMAAPVAVKQGLDVIAVPMLKQAVQKGEVITADNIVMQEIPAKQAYVSTITDAAVLTGQQAVRPLLPGVAVNKLHVRVAPLVSRNQVVTLQYRKGGIVLSGRAQALEDGQMGQSIRIVNPSTRSTLLGTVISGDTVEVN